MPDINMACHGHCSWLILAAVMQAQVGPNYFGTVYLTELLLTTLKSTAQHQHAPTRIVWITSAAEVYGDVDWDDLTYALPSFPSWMPAQDTFLSACNKKWVHRAQAAASCLA